MNLRLLYQQFYSMKNPQAYVNHQLNTSKAKAAFLFPKQKRFNHRSKFITQSFYDVPSTKGNRTTTFGYGSKSSLLGKSQSPPPGTYQLSSDFQKQKSGISFGKGRQNVQFGSFLQGSKTKKFIPSPDKYTVPLPLSKVAGKIFCRLPTQLDFISKKKTPGPGTYDPKGCHVAESGSYILSQMKNLGSPRLYSISSASMDRIGRKRNSSELSPTTYDTLQKQRGKYYNSKHKNLQVRSFGKSLRDGPQDKSKKNFPGFRYKRFSQFGSYV